MSDRLPLLLAEIEAAPSMRPICDRWAAEIRAELAEREADDTDHLEDDLCARAKRAGLVRDSIGWSHRLSQVRVVALDVESRWWWAPESDSTDTRRYRETEEEALIAYLDSLVFEPMRLAHAIREYLDRAGIVVDHGAERIASEQARALETLLSRQVLGTLAEAPIEQLLSVALDLAEEQGEHSEAIRKRVASTFMHLGGYAGLAKYLPSPTRAEVLAGRPPEVVFARHDWPLRGAPCVCRRCGLERRGDPGAWRYVRRLTPTVNSSGRTAGPCAPREAP